MTTLIVTDDWLYAYRDGYWYRYTLDGEPSDRFIPIPATAP